MKFFREKKVVEFDERKVEVYEINVKSLLKLTSGEYKNNEELLLDNSNLNADDLENISIEAFREIEDTFLELNKKHFEKEGEEKIDKKKS
jgi:hypothetical protein